MNTVIMIEIMILLKNHLPICHLRKLTLLINPSPDEHFPDPPKQVYTVTNNLYSNLSIFTRSIVFLPAIFSGYCLSGEHFSTGRQLAWQRVRQADSLPGEQSVFRSSRLPKFTISVIYMYIE